MEITAIKSFKNGSIQAEFDGIVMTVPKDMANRHYREIIEQGMTIPDYVAPAPTGADINNERQRRIDFGCIVTLTDGTAIPVQGRAQDQTNLLGLATAAQLRLAAGDTTTTTTFRDGDNVDHDLTPSEIIELWQSGANYISAVMEASWVLKDSNPIPSDYVDDSYWPTDGRHE